MSVVSKDPVAAWKEVVRMSEIREASALPAFRSLWGQVRADAERMVSGIIRFRALRAAFKMAENARELQLRVIQDGQDSDLDPLLNLTSKFESLLEQVESLERSLQAWEEAACRSWRVVREAEQRIERPVIRLIK